MRTGKVDRRRRGRRPAWCVGLLLLLSVAQAGATAPGAASDVVILRPSAPGRAPQRRVGQILEYTGEALTLRLAAGQEERIVAARIAAVQPARSPAEDHADRLYDDRRYDEALVAYRDLAAQEPRLWRQRQLAAQLVRCQQALGQTVAAAETFARIVAADPATPAYDTIPLAWVTQAPPAAVARQAKVWMTAEQPAVLRLIGASWLVTTAERAAALETLRALVRDGDPRIAALAEAQAWRTELVTARAAQVAGWRARVAAMPSELRSGPHFVLGLALAQQRQHDPAALEFLRVPTLAPQNHPLVAEALLAAGRQLDEGQQTVEAELLYHELVTRYADTAAAKTARERLDARPPN